jgi:NADH dehydrogenase [ubiquinone] 1 alpha subcomplex assembly factor 7
MIKPGILIGSNVWKARNVLPRHFIAAGECRRWATSSKQNKKKAMRTQRERSTDEPEITPISSQHNMNSPPPQTFTTASIDPSSTPPSSAFSLSQTAGKTPTKLDFTRDLSDYNWQSDKKLLRLDQPDELSFDKESMFDPSIHLPYAPKDWKEYEPATPLSDFLFQRIGVSGQITTAEYMRHCLTNPDYGYYTNPPTSLEKAMNDDNWDEDDAEESTKTGITSKNDSTIIGPKGDFVTAPEVSHVFGHCICVWLMTQWQSMNKPSGVQLVELGPGRGTLITDILQLATSSKLSDFGEAVSSVHLVEASRELRQQQKDALQKALGHLIDFKFVNPPSEGKDSLNQESDEEEKSDSTKFSIKVEWHDEFTSFNFKRDKDLPVMMVLQEFIDALPVHVFQMTEEGWRERLIDVASVGDKKPESGELMPRLRQVLAPNVTPAVELFLDSESYHNLPMGTVVEVCPEGIILVQDMAKVLEESQGVGLIVDYGQEGTGDTLRAFSNHKQVPLTSNPGQVDVTADVDFFALKSCIKDGDIHGFGPVTQGEFLMRMGAGDMVIHTIEEDSTTEDQAAALSEALKYLVMPEYMGERYKVMALGKKREGIFAPPGFN